MESIPAEALLDSYPAPMQEVADTLRAIVRQTVPDAIERVRIGWRSLHVAYEQSGLERGALGPREAVDDRRKVRPKHVPQRGEGERGLGLDRPRAQNEEASLLRAADSGPEDGGLADAYTALDHTRRAPARGGLVQQPIDDGQLRVPTDKIARHGGHSARAAQMNGIGRHASQ